MQHEDMPPLRDPFPTEDVEASRADEALQREGKDVIDGLALLRAQDEAQREGAPLDDLEWVFFRSPAWTWGEAALCGREGWLLWNRSTKEQLAFLVTVMS